MADKSALFEFCELDGYYGYLDGSQLHSNEPLISFAKHTTIMSRLTHARQQS